MNKKNKLILSLFIGVLSLSNSLTASAGMFARLKASCMRVAQVLNVSKMEKNALKIAEWMIDHPLTVTGITTAAVLYEKQRFQSVFIEEKFNAAFDSVSSDSFENEGPVETAVRKICKEHGIENVVIIIEKIPVLNMAAVKWGDKHIIFISSPLKTMWELDLVGMPSFLKIRHLKTIVLHEIGHLLADDTKKIPLLSGLCHPDTRKIVAAGLGISAGMHCMQQGMRVVASLPLSKPVFKGALAALTLHGVLLSVGGVHIGQKYLDFHSIGNAFKRQIERHADAYVHQTACNQKNPELLDDMAEAFEKVASLGFSDGSTDSSSRTHDSLEERAAQARKAAGVLRKILPLENKETEIDPQMESDHG